MRLPRDAAEAVHAEIAFDQLLVDGFDAEQIWQQNRYPIPAKLISSLRRELKRYEKNPAEIKKLEGGCGRRGEGYRSREEYENDKEDEEEDGEGKEEEDDAQGAHESREAEDDGDGKDARMRIRAVKGLAEDYEVIEDMSIQDNVPVLVMEETIMLKCVTRFAWTDCTCGVSDAAMLAPEEVFSGKGDILKKKQNLHTGYERKRRRANKKRKFKDVDLEYYLILFLLLVVLPNVMPIFFTSRLCVHMIKIPISASSTDSGHHYSCDSKKDGYKATQTATRTASATYDSEVQSENGWQFCKII
ncbi:hypothetical protein J5N97_000308 [Dioscorea zingiberensis]|uniref:Uncharacterized protein n=1 Tax=Dioscorea zingiberensis TaxID=325984 RepID=A0A9D5BSM7_9LILI|nr:hypothetical protein J5N97_000308 [Dioscorea zingiberensis]